MLSYHSICGGSQDATYPPIDGPSSQPSSSSQPSVTFDSVLDGQSCRRNRDCNSGLCSVRLFYVLHFSDFLPFYFKSLSHSCWDSFK